MERSRNWDDLPLLLDVKDICGYLGLSRHNAYALANMLGLHLGRRLVVSKARLRSWLDDPIANHSSYGNRMTNI